MKRLNSALGGVDRVEFDTEDEAHSIMDRVDMNDVANVTELPRDEVDLVLDVLVVLGSELPNSVLGIGVDEHSEKHLALERLDIADVLCHRAGEVIHGRVVGGEAGLD